MTRRRSTRRPLAGRVALVAGATRGAGRGVARALGEAGAIVYCTGRSTRGRPSPYGRRETIDETAAMIRAAGGTAAKHAVLAMMQARRGLIVEITESDWIDLFRTGADLQAQWLSTLAGRTRRFRAQIP